MDTGKIPRHKLRILSHRLNDELSKMEKHRNILNKKVPYSNKYKKLIYAWTDIMLNLSTYH